MSGREYVDSPIPDTRHSRSIRSSGGWLVRRISARLIRVTSDAGYIDVAIGKGATADQACELAQYEARHGSWEPLPRRGGPSGPSRSRAALKAAGLRYVESWVSPEASASFDRLKAHLGSGRAALEWALTHAPDWHRRSQEP